MVSLHEIKIGQKAEILEFLSPAIRCFSSRFGIEKGQVITCVAKPGPVVIRKNQQELAIGHKLSKEIFVNVL